MSEHITPAELSKWSELTKRATPGPWRFVVRKKGDPWWETMIGAVAPGHQIVTSHEGGTYPSSDGDFIAAAREAMPRLLAEVERLRARDTDVTVLRLAHREAVAEIERLRALLRAACADPESQPSLEAWATIRREFGPSATPPHE